MHRFLLLSLILLGWAVPAFAQVTVDLHALDALPAHPTAAPSMSHAPSNPLPPSPAPPRRVEAVVQPVAPPPAAQPSAPQPAPPAATLPTAPPPVATLAPVAPPVPTANTAPPPPPPIVASATTAAAAMPAGLRLTFASGQSDLSPTSADAIKQLVQTAPSGDSTTFNVLAYAAGVPNDPSAPRRLSLARAISVRSALMADGVASVRIYMRALGAQTDAGPADRVDVSVLGGNAPAQTKSQ